MCGLPPSSVSCTRYCDMPSWGGRGGKGERGSSIHFFVLSVRATNVYSKLCACVYSLCSQCVHVS